MFQMERKGFYAFACLLFVFSVKGEKCGKPGKPFNAVFEPNKESYHVNEEVEYKCNQTLDYLKGDFKRTCLSDGTWNGSVPTCGTRVNIVTAITCETSYNCTPSVGDDNNKTFCDVQDGDYFAIKLNQSDEIDFIVITSNLTKVTDTNNVIGVNKTVENVKKFRKCNATRDPKNYKTLQFVCHVNRLRGQSINITFTHGLRVYEIQAYTTKTKQCGMPDVPLRAHFEAIPWNNHLGHFTCQKGYHPASANEMGTCVNGVWSSVTHKCVAHKKYVWERCGKPGNPKNGKFELKNPYNNKISYACDHGFVLVGSAQRSCHVNDTWSPPIPKCVRNLALKKKAKHNNGERIQNLSTDGDITTYENQTQNFYGYVDMESNNTSFDFIELSLTPEFVVDLYIYAFNTSTVTKSGFDFNKESGNHTKPICISKNTFPKNQTKCSHPVTARFLVIWFRNNISVHEIIAYNSEEINECGSPDQPLNGRLSNKSNSRVTIYECNDGYNISNKENSMCLNGTWEGKVPRCDPVEPHGNDKLPTTLTTPTQNSSTQNSFNSGTKIHPTISKNIGIAVAVIVISVALITALWFFKKFRVKNNRLDVQSLNRSNKVPETAPETADTENPFSLYENLDSFDYKRLAASDQNSPSTSVKRPKSVQRPKSSRKSESINVDNDLYEGFYNT